MLVWLITIAVVVAVVVLVLGRGGTLGAAQRARRIALVLIVGAVALLAVGATQFSFFRQSGEAATVVLVVDVSESMSRDDVAPTRMQAAKEAARAFLDEAPEDMTVGLVTFGGDVQVLATPTTDRAAVEEALIGLPRSEGTLIGDGLDAAVDVVAARWLEDGEGPAAIVLLSDGRDTGSRVSPLAAAERAAREDIPVYTVVLGEDLEDEAGANSALLADIARTTDADAYTATTASGLIDVYRTIQKQLVVALEISDFGAWFVGAAAVFAVLATFAILYAIRAETARKVTPKPKRVPRDVPRSRRPRTGRGRATRPRP